MPTHTHTHTHTHTPVVPDVGQMSRGGNVRLKSDQRQGREMWYQGTCVCVCVYRYNV
jgi:hypothetical protein